MLSLETPYMTVLFSVKASFNWVKSLPSIVHPGVSSLG